MTFTLRQFSDGDETRLVDLWNATLHRDPLSLDAFRRQTLLNPNFDPRGCLLAYNLDRPQDVTPHGAADRPDGGPVSGPIANPTHNPCGFVLAIAPRTPRLHAGAAGSGTIVGLGVLPAHRRCGVGAQLLNAALAFLKDRGCARVTVAAHEYYAAGTDVDAYAKGIVFLTRRGFRETGQATAMGRFLYDLEWPEDVRAAESRLASEGIEVTYFKPHYTQPLATYFATEFPDWIEFFTRKLDARHDLDEIVIAVDTHTNQVVGYCQHLDTDHVGPFGVAAAYRNRGIGTVMLYRLLDRMRQKGFRFAWFGETGRARPYYERAGFTVTRTYALLERDL